MASTIMAQVVDTAESVQPGIAIPTENGSPTSDVVSKSAPVIETGAPAVEEPANKSEENDTAATDLATDSVPPNPESESANPSTAAPGLPNKHKTESEFNEVVGSSWKEYMNIRRQAGNLDNLNDVRHRDTIVDGMRVVGALLGYLTSLESRMSKISEGIDKDQKDAEKADDTTVDDENKPAPSLSYRFFHADNEFDANGELVESNDRLLAHSNNKEPNTLIRAVYSWTDGVSSNPPKLSIEESPRPEQINLVTLAIYSTPISKFFEKELGFDSVNHDIVRIGTPFRPLLRNLQAIRNHTEALQKTFK